MLGNTVFKSDKLTDLTIDVSTANLIAAPSTPTPVVEQAIERARNGEPLTGAKAVSCGRESTHEGGKLTVA